MTPQAFENLGKTEIEMHNVIARSAEARATGVTETALEDLLLSKITNIKGAISKVPVQNESVILPYIYRRQRRNINTNNWKVTAGVATTGAGTGNIPASAWDVTVTKTGSNYATDLTSIENYFLVGKYVNIFTIDSGTSVGRTLQYKVLAAVNADSGGVHKAKITLEPNKSAAGWSALSSPNKAVYQVTNGNLITLGNSVSDYESNCNQHPAENPMKLLTFWLQTTRETHQYNDEYLKALNAGLLSGYWKGFASLPLAEQKKRQHAQAMREWYNSIWYGQEINELQTVETYAQLPTVVDPANSNCTLEYKANAKGFRTQLNDCSRVTDMQGAALDLDSVASMGYELMRNREADGTSVDTIDFMTDRFTSGLIMQLMNKLYKDKYGVDQVRNYQAEGALKFGDQVMLKYNVYQLPPDLGGYNMAVFTHRYFDDHLASFDNSIKSRGRGLWAIDWSDLEIGIAGTNSASRQTNVMDALYNCVIKPNVTHYQLNSTTWTAILEDPARHAMIENFSGECPKLTKTSCDLLEA